MGVNLPASYAPRLVRGTEPSRRGFANWPRIFGLSPAARSFRFSRSGFSTSAQPQRTKPKAERADAVLPELFPVQGFLSGGLTAHIGVDVFRFPVELPHNPVPRPPAVRPADEPIDVAENMLEHRLLEAKKFKSCPAVGLTNGLGQRACQRCHPFDPALRGRVRMGRNALRDPGQGQQIGVRSVGNPLTSAAVSPHNTAPFTDRATAAVVHAKRSDGRALSQSFVRT